MSNKTSLDPIDAALRKACPVGMTDGTITQVTIRKICGFELFNTRPYHNYETWSDGYVVEDGTFRVEAEDLDDAVTLYCRAKSEGVAPGCISAVTRHNGRCCAMARERAARKNS